MRQGWEIKMLGDVVEIVNGKNQSQVISDDGKYPIYGSGGNIMGYAIDYLCEKGTTIIGRKGNISNPIFIDERFWNVDTAFGIYPKDQSDPKFINYLCQTIDFKSRNKGTTIPSLVKSDLLTIEVSFPKSITEQQRIVAILDEAFTAIAKAKANAEQNLKNAKELFESLLIKIFTEGINLKKWKLEKLEKYNKVVVGYVGPISKEYTNDEAGVLLLSTKNISNKGVSLDKLTRINHQFHNKNKKSQLLPGDILVARHGNSGQSAVIPDEIKKAHALNVIVIKKSETLSSEYICFLLNSGVLDKIAASKGGSVQEIINTSVIKDLMIPVPSNKEQQTIVQQLDALSTETKKLEAIYQQKINDLEELKKSVLLKAFSGELLSKNTLESVVAKMIPLQKVEGISPTDLQAGITALAFQKHIEINKQDAFGHVKAEKIVHLTEYILNIDLERNPVKDAAGPNDFPHAKKVESRAAKAGFYSVAAKKGIGESGYSYSPGRSMNTIITKVQTCLGEREAKLSQLLAIVVPMKTQQAEIVATIYAAWNNLILKGTMFTDDDIVFEARENWREEKLKIAREKFVNALEWMKKNELFIPKGNGKVVLAK
jgi:type I restriction enzyme S subunit